MYVEIIICLKKYGRQRQTVRKDRTQSHGSKSLRDMIARLPLD